MNPSCFIPYEEIHEYAVELADKVRAAGIVPDYIVGPSRGGLLPGVIMSHRLGVPFIPVQWSTRDYEERCHHLFINDDLDNGKTILFVDDINDSGRTVLELIEDWGYTDESPGKLIITALYERYCTARKSDFYICIVSDDTFLNFPWENTK